MSVIKILWVKEEYRLRRGLGVSEFSVYLLVTLRHQGKVTVFKTIYFDTSLESVSVLYHKKFYTSSLEAISPYY